jgi:hypothetical protein
MLIKATREPDRVFNAINYLNLVIIVLGNDHMKAV